MVGDVVLRRLQSVEELLVNVAACYCMLRTAVDHKTHSQCGGQGFEPPLLHQITFASLTKYTSKPDYLSFLVDATVDILDRFTEIAAPEAYLCAISNWR